MTASSVPSTRLDSFTPWLILTGDLIALALFVIIGQSDHGVIDRDNPILGVARTAAPFAGVWIAAAWALGALPRGRAINQRRLLGGALNAWLIAVPIAAVIRAALRGQTALAIPFLLAAWGFGALFLLGWRLAFGLLWARRMRQPVTGQ